MRRLGIFLVAISVMLLICLLIYYVHEKQQEKLRRKKRKIRKTPKINYSDNSLYNINNDSAYRNGVYNQISIDFKPYIRNLYQSIDNLNKKQIRYFNDINQVQYNSMIQILNMANVIEQQIRNYWNSSKFKKDFMYYIALHYASHLLAGSIKGEQQKIKDIFVSYKNKQEQLSKRIEVAQIQQQHLHGEARRKKSIEISDMCKIHKNISIIKGKVGEINTQYNKRVDQQNIETGKRRDYIGLHCGERGARWRDKIMANH